MRPALLAAAAVCLAASAANAQPFTGDQHGDWLVQCVEPAGPCAITQHVVAGNREGIDLEVLAWRVGEDGPMLQVRVPLGTWLRAGIEVRVDGEAIGRMNFERCALDGCYAEVLLDDRLLGLMRTGDTTLFVFRLYDDPDAGIGVPISLTGFAPGFDALAPGP
jgi:invasion protein IalB